MPTLVSQAPDSEFSTDSTIEVPLALQLDTTALSDHSGTTTPSSAPHGQPTPEEAPPPPAPQSFRNIAILGALFNLTSWLLNTLYHATVCVFVEIDHRLGASDTLELQTLLGDVFRVGYACVALSKRAAEIHATTGLFEHALTLVNTAIDTPQPSMALLPIRRTRAAWLLWAILLIPKFVSRILHLRWWGLGLCSIVLRSVIIMKNAVVRVWWRAERWAAGTPMDSFYDKKDSDEESQPTPRSPIRRKGSLEAPQTFTVKGAPRIVLASFALSMILLSLTDYFTYSKQAATERPGPRLDMITKLATLSIVNCYAMGFVLAMVVVLPATGQEWCVWTRAKCFVVISTVVATPAVVALLEETKLLHFSSDILYKSRSTEGFVRTPEGAAQLLLYKGCFTAPKIIQFTVLLAAVRVYVLSGTSILISLPQDEEVEREREGEEKVFRWGAAMMAKLERSPPTIGSSQVESFCLLLFIASVAMVQKVRFIYPGVALENADLSGRREGEKENVRYSVYGAGIVVMACTALAGIVVLSHLKNMKSLCSTAARLAALCLFIGLGIVTHAVFCQLAAQTGHRQDYTRQYLLGAAMWLHALSACSTVERSLTEEPKRLEAQEKSF